MEIHPPLSELLGGHWSFDAPVAAVAWSNDGSVAAFALGDGAVALARAEWEGGPEVRIRVTGGVEVRPPTMPSPPVLRVLAHEGPCRALIAQHGGFLSCGQDGRIVRIGIEGSIDADPPAAARRIDLLAAGLVGWAYASGGEVVVTGTSRRVLTFPAEVSALGFDPTGHRLAVAYRDGASIWPYDGGPTRRVSFYGSPRALAWSPDGAWLGIGFAAGGVRAWRSDGSAEVVPGGHSGEVRSLGFSADGHLLAASGAPRVLCWQLDTREPGECGLPSSRAPVTAMAWHPLRPLIAAGYASGAVLLCQPGAEDVLFIRGAGGGAALWLAWSPDGSRLALATEAGKGGLVLLPDGLFRK